MVNKSRSLKICKYEEAKVALKLLFNFLNNIISFSDY